MSSEKTSDGSRRFIRLQSSAGKILTFIFVDPCRIVSVMNVPASSAVAEFLGKDHYGRLMLSPYRQSGAKYLSVCVVESAEEILRLHRVAMSCLTDKGTVNLI